MHNWKFFKSARCVQVKLENGEDLAALKELDQKLWTVLAASTDGLRFDPATLKLLDTDGDGRIRVPEVRAAVDWMGARFKKLDFLFAGKDSITLSDLDDSTDEGKALLKSFKNILLRAGKADAAEISLADVTGTTDVFNAQPFNGDGVVTPNSTSDASVSDAVAAIVACEGGVPDRGGDMGADQAKVDAFFADAAAYLAWKAAGKDAAVIGDGTAAGYAALQEVEAKIDEFFTPPEDMPLVTNEPDPELPLTQGVHPLWLGKFRVFAQAAVAPALGVEKAETLSRDDWAAVKAKFAPYAAWLGSKAGTAVEGVGDEKLAAFVKDGAMQAKVNDLIQKDLALADEYARLVDCARALRYSAYLTTWLCNYVNQANLYDTERDSVFRTGTLYIDGRACKLCFHVADEGAHAALAEKSKCCLLYAKLTRKATGETREVCAVVTAGRTAPLYVGRNGIFYDCDGNDWDAVVVKVVESQVSLKEAFWAPWAKIGATIAGQFKKFLSSKQDAAVAKVGTHVDATTAAVTTPPPAQPAPAPAPAPAPNGAAIASSVAALGVGVGMAGAACAALVGLVAGLPPWKVAAGVAAIILLVSLPSVILAWFKLRARDLGAILNACGWAVNRPLYFSMGLARTFTRPAALPMGAAVARDPYAKGGIWKVLFALVLAVGIALGVCWKCKLWLFAEKKAPCAADKTECAGDKPACEADKPACESDKANAEVEKPAPPAPTPAPPASNSAPPSPAAATPTPNPEPVTTGKPAPKPVTSPVRTRHSPVR